MTAHYDLILRGGLLLDGTGAPGRLGDLAVTGDRIAAIGGLDGAPGRRENGV